MNDTNKPAPDGSSFAVTVEYAPDRWLLWMSAASRWELERVGSPLEFVEATSFWNEEGE
jgi:hypothetical protein